MPPARFRDTVAKANAGPQMIASEKVDLVQDMTTDCSVVASLCAGTARAERGHARVGLLALDISQISQRH